MSVKNIDRIYDKNLSNQIRDQLLREDLQPNADIFVRCDQRSEVAADYDSLRVFKNPGCLDVCMCVCVCLIGHRMDFLSRFKPQRAEIRWRPPDGISI